jgi:uncharacterized BrkB/YihY/UPF0761 family membrane protein
MRDRLVLLARVAIVVVAVAISLARFVAIDAGSHSASDTLRPWMLETAVIAFIATLAFVAIGRLAPRAD